MTALWILMKIQLGERSVANAYPKFKEHEGTPQVMESTNS